MSMSCSMCEPMETLQSLGDETQAVVTRPKWHQRTDYVEMRTSLAVDASLAQR